MKIECGKYTIYSDKFCYWITEWKMPKKTNKDKDPKEFEDMVTGYYPTPDMLFEAFLEKKARGNDAKTVEGALRKITTARKDALTLIRASVEGGLHRG